MRRARWPFGVLAVAVLAACCGCTQLLSVGEAGVVVGLAVDAGPGRQVTASVALYHYPSPSGGGTPGGTAGGGLGAPGQQQSVVVRGSGANLSIALANAQVQTDVYLDFYATDVLLLGEVLARRPLPPVLNALMRSGQFGLTTEVAVVEGGAGTLLANPDVPGGAAVDIEQRLYHSQGSRLGATPTVFWQFMSRLYTPYRAAWAPLLLSTANGYRAFGTAVFRGERLAGVLDPQQSEAFGWFMKTGGFAGISFRLPDGAMATLRVVGSHPDIAASGPAAGRMRLTLDATVQEAPGVQLTDPRATAALEHEAAAAARREIRTMLDRLQSDGSDVLGFGERVRERDPSVVGADWPSVFSRMRIAIVVDVHIHPSGRLV